MMGFYEELKYYLMFDLVKQQTIIKFNVVFDENTSGLGLLKSSSNFLYNDPFGIVEDIESIVPFKCISASSWTFVLEQIGSWSTPTETITSSDQPSQRNGTLQNPCLPQWIVKSIEATGHNVGYVSTSQQTRSHKQHDSITLVDQILYTCDPKSYVDAQGKLEWEQSMHHDMDSLENNHTRYLVP